jgi:hypothetical protein
MVKLVNIVTLVFVALVASGCASQRYTVVEPPSRPLTDFSVLEIRDFKTNLNDPESADLANTFADTLYAAVLEDREQHPGESIFEEVLRNTDSTDRVLILDGTIISFEKGSQAKRYWIGLGSGKAYITIQSTFTDKVTGDEILKTNFDGELSAGVFGGSFQETVDAVVRAYIDYFDDYFEKAGVR